MNLLPALSARFPSAAGLVFTQPLLGVKLHALRGTFPRLRRLSMRGNVPSSDVAEAASHLPLFTELESLSLGGYRELKKLPDGISLLTRLKTLR